jgi:hypothetical protein
MSCLQKGEDVYIRYPAAFKMQWTSGAARMSSTVDIKIRFLMPCEKNTSFRPDPLLPKIVLLQASLFPQAPYASLPQVFPTTRPSQIWQKTIIIFAIINIKTPTI